MTMTTTEPTFAIGQHVTLARETVAWTADRNPTAIPAREAVTVDARIRVESMGRDYYRVTWAGYAAWVLASDLEPLATNVEVL